MQIASSQNLGDCNRTATTLSRIFERNTKLDIGWYFLSKSVSNDFFFSRGIIIAFLKVIGTSALLRDLLMMPVIKGSSVSSTL